MTLDGERGGGSGYVLTPEVTIGGGDNSNSGSGTFTFNEIVTGSTSGITARVKTWNSETNTLELSNVTGDFTLGERVVGSDSGPYVVRVQYEDDIVDTFADNDNIESALMQSLISLPPTHSGCLNLNSSKQRLD